ncbi:hypothetical protein QFZ82_007735 [Streptomyces sp. V4I23]|nr:hypothetical protein [Streptomyces sp. V4I23]
MDSALRLQARSEQRALFLTTLAVPLAVDFAAAPPHTDRRYTRIDLLVDVLDLALPQAHPCARREHVPLRDLAADTWIVGDSCSCCGAITRSLCAANGFTPDIRHAVNDWQSLAALVETGMGVALVPRLVQPLHRPGLVLRSPAGPPPTRHAFVAVRAGSDNDPVLSAVLNHLRAARRPPRARPEDLPRPRRAALPALPGGHGGPDRCARPGPQRLGAGQNPLHGHRFSESARGRRRLGACVRDDRFRLHRHDDLRRRGGPGRAVPATSRPRWPRRSAPSTMWYGCGICCPTGLTPSPAGRSCAGISARSGRPPRCCGLADPHVFATPMSMAGCRLPHERSI